MEIPLLGVQEWKWEWMLGRMKDPEGLLLCPWLLSGGVRRAEAWLLGGRYWSNSWTSKPSMVPMTSVLRSEMSTLLKSMFCRLLAGTEPPLLLVLVVLVLLSTGRWASRLFPMWRSVLGVVGGVGGP